MLCRASLRRPLTIATGVTATRQQVVLSASTCNQSSFASLQRRTRRHHLVNVAAVTRCITCVMSQGASSGRSVTTFTRTMPPVEACSGRCVVTALYLVVGAFAHVSTQASTGYLARLSGCNNCPAVTSVRSPLLSAVFRVIRHVDLK